MRRLSRRFTVAVLVLLLVGASLKPGPPRRVPIRSVDPSYCDGNGPVVSVTKDSDGIYHVRCADGFVALA